MEGLQKIDKVVEFKPLYGVNKKEQLAIMNKGTLFCELEGVEKAGLLATLIHENFGNIDFLNNSSHEKYIFLIKKFLEIMNNHYRDYTVDNVKYAFSYYLNNFPAESAFLKHNFEAVNFVAILKTYRERIIEVRKNTQIKKEDTEGDKIKYDKDYLKKAFEGPEEYAFYLNDCVLWENKNLCSITNKLERQRKEEEIKNLKNCLELLKTCTKKNEKIKGIFSFDEKTHKRVVSRKLFSAMDNIGKRV